ncbi:thiolase family protein [Limisalsivibrio acetivorans]|uniref:thiolase family protein n=1 Tax=Limisalsivibrio acetivorans TaxID=1304888 RepID=UPI0004296293|nr:thiolase family protein [Limisalsivibrio acetivorans]
MSAISHLIICDRIKIPGRPAIRVETASSTGAAAFFQAYASIASGIYKNVLVIAAEKMTHLGTDRVTEILASVIDPAERITGASMPSLAALCTNRFRHETRISEDKLSHILGSIAVKSHHYGAMNPMAQFRKEIDYDKYFSSKLVADPLRLYDCSPISDGSAAVLLTADETDIEVAGVGQGTDRQALCKRPSITSFYSTRKAAYDAYRMAGCSPSDIDFAEIHDAFTTFEMLGIVDTGLVDKSNIMEFYLDGAAYHDGSLPVNISGGLKSRGHPVGASGLAQIAEAFNIMSDRYPLDITPNNTDTCLTQSIGGLATNNFVIILKKRTKTFSKGTDFPKPEYSNVINRTSKRLKLFSKTTLHITPKGVPSPLNLVICNHEDKRFLARYEGELPRIGTALKIKGKEHRIVTVTKPKNKLRLW